MAAQQTQPRGPHPRPQMDVTHLLREDTPMPFSDHPGAGSRPFKLNGHRLSPAIARISLRLSDLPGGQCRVAMTEVAASRPLSWVPDNVQLLGAAPRNRECTWRLAMIAEQNVPDAAEKSPRGDLGRDRHPRTTETRHTVVAGTRRRLDQPAMNSWKADSKFGGSAVTLHWRSVSPIGDRMPRRS